MSCGSHFQHCRDILRDNGVVLYFKGPVTQEVVEGLGSMIRRKVDFEIDSRTKASSVFAVLVEQLQNVLHYAADSVDLASGRMAKAELVIRHVEEGFSLTCGNQVAMDRAGRISERLDALAAIGKEDLKALYKSARQNGPDDLSRGAGLGLLEMARRAVKPLRYEIVPIDARLGWFWLDVVIS